MAFMRVSTETGYRFPAGAFDLRGYEVRTGIDDAKAGTVHDILADDTGVPRYLDVDLGLMQKHVLLPVGHAMADPDQEQVVLPGLEKEDLERVPEAVEDAAIDRDYEKRLSSAYGHTLSGERTYARPEYGATAPFRAADSAGSGSLARVDQLDEIDVADYDPDPRGWDVVTADEEHVGRVEHLIGDTAAMQVRYLVVALDSGEADEARKVLVPIGFASLDTDARKVRLDWIESALIRSLPAYQGTVDRAYTDRLHQTLDREPGERWYEHPRYSIRRLYGSPPPRG